MFKLSVIVLIHEYGLVAVAAIIGLECLGLPVPGQTALLGTAIYAGTKHDLNINAVIVTAAGPAIAGRMMGYFIGHKFGSWLLLRYGHYVGLTTGRMKLVQYLFLRYGGKIIFFAQFVPVLRTLAGATALTPLLTNSDLAHTGRLAPLRTILDTSHKP